MLVPSSQKKVLSLREQTYKHLREAIISGKIRSGTRLVESVLAKEMGVSRTPIREALYKLGSEELINLIPSVGYIVSDFSEHDIADLIATRRAIEQLAAKLALENITSEELERLDKNVSETDRMVKKGFTRKMIDLDTEFHDIICKASRSKRFYQISQMLREHMLKFRKACLHIPEVARRSRDEHIEIFEAIKSKDKRRLNAALLSHMAGAQKDIMDYLKRLRESL